MIIENLGLFITASFLLWITPGQDTIYIIARSITQGKLAGIVSALGIGTGALFHAALAAAGISIIILTSPVLFMIVKVSGGLYLIYLGINALRSSKSDDNMLSLDNENLRKIFTQGVITNVLNPKVALFFIAFLPQFANSNEVTTSLILLGAIFVIGGTLWCFIIAIFASYFSTMLRQKENVSKWIGKISGMVYIGLGLNILRAKV